MKLLSRALACQQGVELLTDYLEGRLSRRNRKRLERHLGDCPNCSAYLEQLRSSVDLAARLDTPSVDEATRDGLMEMFRKYSDPES